ncbi:MAG TPA: DUF192 domain-containing protein [Planctomycetota bacterium]|nr:DUF192 domain-containing protein [Planctomycetota bacterium]
MKRWILPAVAVLLAGAIAWPFIFGGGTVEVKGKSFVVEHRLLDDGPMSRFAPTRNRGALPAGSSILCSWDRDRYLYFWSDGAKAAFDVAFLDAAGKVLQVGRLRPFSGRDFCDDAGLASTVEARRALFLPEGTTDDVRLAAGDTVSLSSDLTGAKPEPMPVIKVGGLEVRAELVETYRGRQRGLMHRPMMSKDEGMLFAYPKEQSSPYLSFYMRHTLMPLDIAFFDGKGRLVNAVPTERAANPATEGSGIHSAAQGPARFVLEMPIGWFREKGLTDDKGKPVKEVLMELPDILRARADKAESSSR